MAEIRQLQAPVTKAFRQSQPDPTLDAQRERARASFSAFNMGCWIHGSADALSNRQRLVAELCNLPWADKTHRYFLTRKEEYMSGLRAAIAVWERMLHGHWSQEDALLVRSMVDMPGGLELHIGMFIPSIRGQGTKAQRQYYLPKCASLEIIGTYAQTELGHGTFVRGLETTSIYDPSTKQFVIHSPTETSTKWWPGGLGKTATHAVVMARLIIHGKDYGPHGFIVQLRDLQGHKLLPGIEAGDIGPKFGYNGVDNGFLRFDHVVVPLSAMLSKFAKVTEQGEYVPPPPGNQKASYSTMLFVRADIVRNASNYLAKAACIAVRYCCVRRQTAANAHAPELQVLDYQSTAAALLPAVATAYVTHAMGMALWKQYKDYERLRTEGDFRSLPELHALSAGLKAVVTSTTADAIESCRRCCGGHGYSALSGLPSLYASYVQNCTWEGDNNVMLLQAARYALKQAVTVSRTGVTPEAKTCSYLIQQECQIAENSLSSAMQEDTATLQWAHRAFASYAQYLVQHACSVLMKHPESGGQVVFEGAAWNNNTVTLIEAAEAHCEFAMLTTYMDTLRTSQQLQGAEHAVAQRLGALWALHMMRRKLGRFIESGSIRVDQAVTVHALFFRAVEQLRPDAIALVDAWHLSDYELNSALGRQDGQVYRALFEMAQNSPLNATEEGPAWETCLKPAIQRFTAKL